jgi:hypothetical protein
VSPVTYKLGLYIPEDGILYGHRRENLKSYIALSGWTLYRRRNVSPVRYELGFYNPEDGILYGHQRENLKSYIVLTGWALYRRHNVSPIKYELRFYIPEGSILRSHRRENREPYIMLKHILKRYASMDPAQKEDQCQDFPEYADGTRGSRHLSR